MNDKGVNPYAMDWGEIFVESYNTITKNATLVYNFNFESDRMSEVFFNYSVAHIFWVFKNLPPASSITAIYDLRWRVISDITTNNFEEKIRNYLFSLDRSLMLNIVFNK